MNKKQLAGLLLFLLPAFTIAQPAEQILLEIDEHKITAEEFKRIYEKNNPDTADHAKGMEEYLDLFIDFKIKVIEAQNRGLDTTRSFRKELEHYRNELAKPYLANDKMIDSMLKEAYRRKKEERKVSHILIKVPKDAAPEDTAAAYKKAMQIKNRIDKGGDFAKLASENSEDPSARRNSGMIGYISAFKTVPPFEDAVYQLDTGEVSEPVRTRFGYHIIKLHDIRKAPGKVRVAHIMLSMPQNSKNKRQEVLKDSIREIHNQLQLGADFAELAKRHSADKRSAKNGGKLPWFGTGRMVPSFEKAAFALDSIGEISKPIKTAYGWHILKLLDKKPVEDFEALKSKLKTKLRRTGRMQQAEQARVAELKQEYNFKQNGDLEPVLNNLDTTVFKGNWKAPKEQMNKTLVAFGDTTLTTGNFAAYIENKQKSQQQKPLSVYAEEMFRNFVADKIMAYEKSRLDEKYPRFRYLMKEYHDGILLFELTDREIWTKAVEDTMGLKAFYEKNKNNYRKPDRLDVTIFRYKPEANKAFRELRRLLRKKERKEYSNQDIVQAMEAEGYKLSVMADTVFAKGRNKFVDAVWKENLDDVEEINHLEDKQVVAYVKQKLEARPKKLKEARGLVTADYQDYLENKWIKQLKEKYSIKVHEDVLNTLRKNNE